MNLVPYAIIWAVLATLVIVLAIYRSVISGRGDEMLHVHDAESALVTQQAEIAKKLGTIDRWGKSLTILVVLVGAALICAYAYQVWQETGSIAPR